ncbi:MAG: hypothetical protein O3A46_13775 [Candidatus Poribacteria bacterium]|nr:hypothetical protein [Candidatus Poribacteria bacterium]
MAQHETREPLGALPTSLSKSIARRLYERAVHTHLERLLGLDLVQNGTTDTRRHRRFDLERYNALQQNALENGIPGTPLQMSMKDARENAKAHEIDFDEWATTIAERLGIASSTDEQQNEWSEYVTFTRSIVRAQATYYHAYGADQSPFSPWSPLAELIAGSGLMLGITKDPQTRRVKFLVRGENDKSATSKTGELTLDSRYEVQQVIHAYLHSEGHGFANRKTLPMMVDYLIDKWDTEWTGADLQTRVLTPLKRAGVIGSVRDGFFLLASPDDCERSLHFHDTKLRSILAITDAAQVAHRRFKH